MLRLFGFFLLIFSTLLWCVLPVLLFLDLSTQELAVTSSSVFITAEVAWWASVPIFGKEFVDKGKLWLKQRWSKSIT